MSHYIVTDKMDLPGKGEDHVSQGFTTGTKVSIACIADGVSRSEEPKQGALIAADSACRKLTSHYEFQESFPDYQEIYTEIVRELNEKAVAVLKLSHETPRSLFATTLITACINKSFAQFSYVGNGAIIEIRKEWWELAEDNLLLLGINNYLSPNTRFKDGDTLLYKVLKVDQDNNIIHPEIITIYSDSIEGSIFLICTDGLFTSEDFTPLHHPENGEFYRKENPRLMMFLQTLKKYGESIKSNPDEFMMAFRENIMKQELLTDDLTYALFIP